MTAPNHPSALVKRRGTAALVVAIILSLAVVVTTQRWLETNPRPALQEESLYISGASVKHLRMASMGFNGLVADYYWMRALQYVGRKASAVERFRLDNLASLDLKLLAPLLDAVTTLDPQFMTAYEFGAVVLPTVSDTDSDQDAIALLKKGIEANPGTWKLHHHLGYIHWQRNDLKSAAEAYAEGSRQLGAPAWMRVMSARMASEGGSRELAREIYFRIFENSTDDQIKRTVELRLLQLDSFDRQDLIRRFLNHYLRKNGECAQTWKSLALYLRDSGLAVDSSGAPLDPTGVAYELKDRDCEVELSEKSMIPRK